MYKLQRRVETPASEFGPSPWRVDLDNTLLSAIWFWMLVLVGWMLIIPPITPATNSFYVGRGGHPARVGLEDRLFQWTVYGYYPTAAECDQRRSKIESQGMGMYSVDAGAVAYSFAKCVEDDDSRLKPNNGSIERWPSSDSADGRRRVAPPV